MSRRYPPVPVKEVARLVHIVRRLRRDCPWDRKQTHRSLRGGLIEETFEVIDALDRRDAEELKKELGDLLLHITLHATIAEQSDEFTLKDLIGDISAKLIRRHPHVFGSARVRNASEVKHNWEKLKLREGRTSVVEGVPKGMPALQRALRVQERASRVGFDWEKADDVWEKVREELEEFRSTLNGLPARRREEEFGDLLFALVNYARFVGVDPETALRSTIDKFIRRFRYIERELKRRGRDVHDSTLDEMDGLWNVAKKRRTRTTPASRA
jgi:MazG family protein